MAMSTTMSRTLGLYVGWGARARQVCFEVKGVRTTVRGLQSARRARALAERLLELIGQTRRSGAAHYLRLRGVQVGASEPSGGSSCLVLQLSWNGVTAVALGPNWELVGHCSLGELQAAATDLLLLVEALDGIPDLA